MTAVACADNGADRNEQVTIRALFGFAHRPPRGTALIIASHLGRSGNSLLLPFNSLPFVVFFLADVATPRVFAAWLPAPLAITLLNLSSLPG